MKEQVYKLGFPSVKRLIAVLSLIALLAFMSTAIQTISSSDRSAMQEESYQESLEEFESLFTVKVR